MSHPSLVISHPSLVISPPSLVISQVKAMGKPPAGVKLVLNGVCIMFELKPIMEKDPDGGTKKIANWHKTAMPMLSNPAGFLDS